MKFALNDSKDVFMIIRRWIFEFYFCSYAWMSLTCSRSFPCGVASGGLHLLIFFLYIYKGYLYNLWFDYKHAYVVE